MDSRVAILGANGTGKSTLLHLITGALQPCEGTISKHSALKLAKYSQHSADQLPYDKSPIEYFQSLFSQKFPEKDVMVGLLYSFLALAVIPFSLIFNSSLFPRFQFFFLSLFVICCTCTVLLLPVRSLPSFLFYFNENS